MGSMVRTRTVELGKTELGMLRTCARAARARPRVRAPLRLSPSSYLSSDLFLKIVSVSVRVANLTIPSRSKAQYCRVEQNGTRDVATSIARPDHRKSKFGLRHAIKLIELYCVTKSEF